MLNKMTKLKKIIIGLLIICSFIMQNLFTNFSYAADAKAIIYNKDEKVEEFDNASTALDKAIELGKDSSKAITLSICDDVDMTNKEIPKDCKLTIDLNNHKITPPSLDFDKFFTVYGSLTMINTVPEGAQKNVNLTGFMSKENGAVFDIKSGGSVTLKNLIISDCAASKRGGAIYVPDGAALKIDNCKFNNIFSGEEGGAIYIDCKDKEVEINNSDFTNCSSTGGAGGAINIYNGKISFNNNTFNECSAVTGGAIASYYPEYCRVNQISITKCKAIEGCGGGIYNGKVITFSRKIYMNDNEGKGRDIFLKHKAYIADAGITYDSKIYIAVDTRSISPVLVKNATQGKVNRGIYAIDKSYNKNAECEFVSKTSIVAGDFASSVFSSSPIIVIVFIMLPVILVLIILVLYFKKKKKTLEEDDKTDTENITTNTEKEIIANKEEEE